jgi:acetoin utilization deacetylase AcuC-like enzyme
MVYLIFLFQGTGSIARKGEGKGKYYNVNVPLHDGMNDEKYINTFKKIANRAKEQFQPQVVVLQW